MPDDTYMVEAILGATDTLDLALIEARLDQELAVQQARDKLARQSAKLAQLGERLDKHKP